MTRLLTEGFEAQDLVEWFLTFATGSSGIDTTVSRTGAASLQLSSGAASAIRAFIAVDAVLPNELYIRVCCRVGDIYPNTNRGSFRLLYMGVELFRCDFQKNTGIVMTCNALTATGTTSFLKDTWYRIECHVILSNAAGLCELRVDGGAVEARIVGDTLGTYSGMCELQLYGSLSASDGNLSYFDDVAINDCNGSEDNSWCGDGYIIALTPTGTITNQLTGSDADTTDNHLLVDEIPYDSDTTYVGGVTANLKDIYDMSACGLDPVNNIITRIWTEARAKTGNYAPAKQAAAIIKPSGGADIESPSTYLGDAYTKRVIRTAGLTINPVDNEPFKVSDVDAIQAGVIIKV